MTGRHILIPIDDFAAAKAQLEYAVNAAAGGNDSEIHLFHAVGPLPPRLLEFRGAEDPAEEEQLEAELARRQELWLKDVRPQVEALFRSSRAILTASGIPDRNIHAHFVMLKHREDLVTEIIEAAHDNACDTVVVGRSSYSWFKELFQNHVSDQLAARSQQLTILTVD